MVKLAQQAECRVQVMASRGSQGIWVGRHPPLRCKTGTTRRPAWNLFIACSSGRQPVGSWHHASLGRRRNGSDKTGAALVPHGSRPALDHRNRHIATLLLAGAAVAIVNDCECVGERGVEWRARGGAPGIRTPEVRHDLQLGNFGTGLRRRTHPRDRRQR